MHADAHKHPNSIPGFWSIAYAQSRGWIPTDKQEGKMKYQIRREANSFDLKIIMYNVYDASRYEAGTAKGYFGGFPSLDEAIQWVERQRTPEKLSELMAEIEV